MTELKPIDAGTGIATCEWRITGTDDRLRARAIVEILWRRGEPELLDPVTVDADGTVQVLV